MLAFYIAAGIIIALVVIWLFKIFVGAAVSIETSGPLLLKQEMRAAGVNPDLFPDAALKEIVAHCCRMVELEYRPGQLGSAVPLKGHQASRICDAPQAIAVELNRRAQGLPPLTAIGVILDRWGALGKSRS